MCDTWLVPFLLIWSCFDIVTSKSFVPISAIRSEKT